MHSTRLLLLASLLSGACSSETRTAGASGGAAGAPAQGGQGGVPVGTGGVPVGTGGAPVGAGGANTSGGAKTSGGNAAAAKPTIAEFVGLNGFIDDEVPKLSAVGNVREYHNWSWNDGNGEPSHPPYPNNPLSFSLFDGFWNFDDYYSKLAAAGVLVVPCLQGSVSYLNDARPPVSAGASPTDPASYVAHASFLFQYAARYGKRQVEAAKLRVASGQRAVSGLGLLPYYENGNEPDANWVKPDGSFLFTPEATAAMSSADYDGHQGRLGDTFGVKNADPEAKLVLAGLAGAGASATDWVGNVTSYLDGMRAWAAANRSGSFPADVLNVHDYCFGPDPFGTSAPRPALSPEDCKLGALLGSIALYRDQHLPGKEVWLTEFGYDTHPRSRLRAPAIAGNSAEVVQGQWLVRSLLALLSSGIERAFLFISRDACTGDDVKCPNNAVQFSSSGVLSEKGKELPKVAWYYLAAFRSRLGPMRYWGSSASGDPSVQIAKMYSAETNQGAYVVWSPTSRATVVEGYRLALKPPLSAARLVTLTETSVTGVESPLAVTNGSVLLTVSETPSLVLVAGEP